MKCILAAVSILVLQSFASASTPLCYGVDAETQTLTISNPASQQLLLKDVARSLKSFSEVIEMDASSMRLVANAGPSTNGQALISITGVDPDGDAGDHWFNYYKFVIAVHPTTCKLVGKTLNLGEIKN